MTGRAKTLALDAIVPPEARQAAPPPVGFAP